MKNEKIVYTDGHEVTVTSDMLKVNKKWYTLNGIIKHNFSILPPTRVACYSLIVFGAVLEVIGAAVQISSSVIPEIYVANQWVNANLLAMGGGIFFLLAGAVWMMFTKERYAVSITTAEGERNVVISEHKEYITQIVNALNEAFFARIESSPPTLVKTRKREYVVSAR